jgi:DnaJ-class molecular chaperone
MTTIKQYPSLCTTCNGTGQLSDQLDTTNPHRCCPVCTGLGTVTVTETIFDNDYNKEILPHDKPIYSFENPK